MSVQPPTVQGPICDGASCIVICNTVAGSKVKVYVNGVNVTQTFGNGGCVKIKIPKSATWKVSTGDKVTAQQFVEKAGPNSGTPGKHVPGKDYTIDGSTSLSIPSPVSWPVLVEADMRPTYNPAYWNDPKHVTKNNCYNYACDIRNDTWAEPGYAYGIDLCETLFDCFKVGNAAEQDGLKPMSTFKIQSSGCKHLVALAIYPGAQQNGLVYKASDFHWYRLDNNGFWSHKPAETPATDVDGSTSPKPITNPETADRRIFVGPDFVRNYSIFCGYYCVDKKNVVIVGKKSVRAKMKREHKLAKRIEITLSVYSGRPNPSWWLTKGRDFEKLIHLIKKLEADKKPLFRYEEWNKLGYARFWIETKNIEGLPYAIHVWRDMAYVVQNLQGEVMYSLGANEIYDLLVAQAEERNQGAYFTNYHKYKEEMTSPSNL